MASDRIDNGSPAGDNLVLVAPLDGWAAPLSEVPDPVFAGKLMGDGVAIDPASSLLSAPCDGEVILLHDAHHAITLRAANGAEILIHIGLDTVNLSGGGFTPHVTRGQRVTAGAPLISFDLDHLGRTARSLITPMIIANGEDFVIEWRLENSRVVRGQEVMRLRRVNDAAAPTPTVAQEIRRPLIIPLAYGLHARPAARLADLGKSFSSQIVIESGARRANLRSPVAIMGLGLAKGASVDLIATGADADQAIAAIAALVESGMGEATAAIERSAPVMFAAPGRPGMVTGTRASPGIALGKAVRFAHAEIAVNEHGNGASYEAARLSEALASVSARLSASAIKDRSAILAAHLAFLNDPELAADAAKRVADGKSAGHAWRTAIQTQIAVLKGLKDPVFVERAADLLDVERQVLVALGDAHAEIWMELPRDAILLAADLLPSEFAALDTGRLQGICLANGGPTSHATILAAAANIPMLVACGSGLLSIPDGTPLILDADQGLLAVDPAPARLDEVGRQAATRRDAAKAARTLAHQPCHTKDGVRIEVNANLGSINDTPVAVAAGAEGCGLLRTEFLFLNRESPPSESEQIEAYRAIAHSLEGRPLVVRTLDIGADKPARYLSFPPEENPALGLRGVRVSLWRPDLLDVQLRAILKAIPASQCRIMVPMIASLDELRVVRHALDRVSAELRIGGPLSLGVMVETPAAAMTADLLAAEADFLSIGTNDLTQYCLAMDRGHAGLAPEFDALHPAVLRLIAATTEGAAKHARPVAVCGGLASDVLAAPVLIGLGVRSLSAAAGQIPALKAHIRGVTLDQCRRLAEKSLAAHAPADVRALVLAMGEN